MKEIILVTGGQRSGKSRYAHQLALSLTDRPVYVATARIGDDEFRQRVRRHQAERGPEWTTIEEDRWLSRHDLSGRVAVIDCITLWCSNFLFDRLGSESSESKVQEAVNVCYEELRNEFDRFTAQDAVLIFVTNEIGMGGISPDLIQRQFTDLQGWMNQYIARKADRVVYMVSGIPVPIKTKS